MNEAVFKLCVVAPVHPAARDVYRRVLRLLGRDREHLDLTVVRPDWNSVPEEAGWTIARSLGELDFEESERDLLICWDLPTVSQVLAKIRDVSIVYGITFEGIRQGFFPAHPRITGYFFDVPLMRGVLTSCGIPLERQFSLAAGLSGENCPPPERKSVSKQHRTLLITDGAALISVAKAACEVLGSHLERLPNKAVSKGIPADFLAGYDCIIASGRTALRAAAAGTAVIVADERGCAGVLTREKLQRVLEAHAGPACFENPVSIEVLLSALHDIRATDPAGLAQELCSMHGEAAQARRLAGWLRTAREASEAAAFIDDPESTSSLQLLDIAEMIGISVCQEEDGLTGKMRLEASDPLPASEILVDSAVFGPDMLTPPYLPLDEYISAADEDFPAGLFSEGWSFGESWGRWTESQEAVLHFRLEPVDQDIKLLFYLHGFLPPGCLFQRVFVRANGHPILCWKLERDARAAPYELPMPQEYLIDGQECRISFYMPDIDSPSTWGEKDIRKLGVALSGLKIFKE